jgi:hypothetical protein
MMFTSDIPAAAMPGATLVFTTMPTTMTVPVAAITMPIPSAPATTHTKSKQAWFKGGLHTEAGWRCLSG